MSNQWLLVWLGRYKNRFIPPIWSTTNELIVEYTFCGILILIIVRVEGKYADRLTITAAQAVFELSFSLQIFFSKN